MTHHTALRFLPILLFSVLFLSTHARGEESLMEVVSDEERILVKRGEKVIFVYNKVPTKEAASHEAFYSRDGYIHPVYSPSGKVVSGDYAADHKHQHGLFFAWTKTRLGDAEAEFWNQKLEKGVITYQGTLRSNGGEQSCEFVVEHLWEARAGDGSLIPALKETWTVTARDAGEDLFLFDIESVQTLQGGTPLTIEKHHYGGMAFRGSDQWLLEKEEPILGVILRTDGGLGRDEGNHSRPRWVTMAGPVDGELAGVTVMGHPDNFRSPQWVRLHPTKPYFVWAPMVEESFQITGDKPYRSRYRYIVADGDVQKDRLEAIWRDFAGEE